MSERAKRRGRPPTFDRSAAIEVATRLFWRHGYEGTSIAMLTEATGFTPPTLYAAFGSKADLYREALAHYRAWETQAGLVQPAGSSSVYRTVERYLRAAARRFADPDMPRGCMVSVGSLHCAADNHEIAAAAECARAEGLQDFVSRLEHARLAGEIPERTDTDALARFYAAIVQGMSVQAIDGADAATLDALVDIALSAWPARRSPWSGT